MSEEELRQPVVNTGSAPQIMSTPPTPTSTRARRRRSHDTGFPEPFNEDYNTTLPHPEANLSPNAFISSDSLSAPHLLERRRTSILLKHRRTNGLVPLMTGMMGGGREDHHADVTTPRLSGTTTTTDGSLESCTTGEAYEHDTPPTSPDIPSRRRGILDRLRRNKSRAKR